MAWYDPISPTQCTLLTGLRHNNSSNSFTTASKYRGLQYLRSLICMYYILFTEQRTDVLISGLRYNTNNEGAYFPNDIDICTAAVYVSFFFVFVSHYLLPALNSYFPGDLLNVAFVVSPNHWHMHPIFLRATLLGLCKLLFLYSQRILLGTQPYSRKTYNQRISTRNVQHCVEE